MCGHSFKKKQGFSEMFGFMQHFEGFVEHAVGSTRDQ